MAALVLSGWNVTSPANLPKERGGMAKLDDELTRAVVLCGEQSICMLKTIVDSHCCSN
jgi:hypothetical protein